MNYELNGSDLDILLISLIGRRNSIKGLLATEGMNDNFYTGYREEMNRVDSLLEKFFPGSIARLLNPAA